MQTACSSGEGRRALSATGSICNARANACDSSPDRAHCATGKRVCVRAASNQNLYLELRRAMTRERRPLHWRPPAILAQAKQSSFFVRAHSTCARSKGSKMCCSKATRAKRELLMLTATPLRSSSGSIPMTWNTARRKCLVQTEQHGGMKLSTAAAATDFRIRNFVPRSKSMPAGTHRSATPCAQKPFRPRTSALYINDGILWWQLSAIAAHASA